MSTELSTTARQQGELWDAGAHDWAQLMAPTLTSLWGPTLDLARVTRGTRLLDIGSGSGEVMTLARFRGATVAGIDPAPAMVHLAGERVPEADVRRGDMATLPFDDGSFDAAIFLNSLMYADDTDEALAESARVLADGGTLAVAIWGDPAACAFRSVMETLRGLLPEAPTGGGPFSLSEPGVLDGLLVEAGFEIVEDRTVASPFTFADEDHFIEGIIGTGPGQGVIRESGEAAVREALIDLAPTFAQRDGSYRIDNEFRVVGARLR